MTKSQAQRRHHVERTAVPAIKRTRGRPTIYTPEMVAQACFMAEQGATDVEIARELGISISRFYIFANQYPEFREAIKNGKDAIDDRVERSLLMRATGFTVKTQKLHQGNIVNIDEYFAPDTGAAKHWLGNRRRDKWRSESEVSIIVPETPEQIEEQSDRTLALAALALFSDSVGEPEDQNVILDLEANEETEDGRTQDDPSQSEQASRTEGAARQRRSRRAEFIDPDFDD